MRGASHVSTALAVSLLFWFALAGPVYAEEESRERPFGGPPPTRGPIEIDPESDAVGKLLNFECRTPSTTCRLTVPQEKGTDCICRDANGTASHGHVL